MQTMNLFQDQEVNVESGIRIDVPDADILYYDSLFSSEDADRFLDTLMKETEWQQQKIKLYGKEHNLPRKTAWYGDLGKSYVYSGIKSEPTAWSPTLLEIKERIEQEQDVEFNSVLLNYYRDGNDSVAWHADDEPELGTNPVIGSVSLGEPRKFQMRHKHRKDQRESILLKHGSYLLMKGTTQHHWEHQIAKTKREIGERINLTFRRIV